MLPGINLADENDIRYMALYKDVFQFAARWSAAFVVVHTNEAFDGEKERIRESIRRRLKKLLVISDDYIPVGDGTIDWTPVFAAITSFAPKSTMVFEYADVDVQTALANISMVRDQYLNPRCISRAHLSAGG